MNKRTERIRSLLTAAPDEELTAVSHADQPTRVVAGSVRSLENTFSFVEQENDRLKEQLRSGERVVEIAPDLIVPSPFNDRFDDHDWEALESLKASIREQGQSVPVLLREFPTGSGRYQAAYGHRRIRAARDLGITVRAIIRNLSDAELAIAQGLENSQRLDLTFIERSYFALQLEEAGYDRATVCQAVGKDLTDTYRLLSIARAIPRELAMKIGRAPNIGRPRWQSFAMALNKAGALDLAQAAVNSRGFDKLPSNERFLAVMNALVKKEDARPDQKISIGNSIIGNISRTSKRTVIAIDAAASDGFDEFLASKLDDLVDEFQRSKQNQ